MIAVCNLVKNYGKVLAVDDICFSVPKGICFGLLGPNGAGKTTTIEMMEGILKPTQGTVYYQGQPIGPHFQEKVGIQFQNTAIQDFLTVRDTLELFADLYPQQKSIEEVIELCSLADIIDRDTRKLSGGQRQRMLLALAIINDPEILFLDEPTTGLDPQARRNFWTLINNIKQEGKTIILTTHYMDEAEYLCDDIAIMDHGKIIARGEPKELLGDHFKGIKIQVPDRGREAILKLIKESKVENGKIEFFTKNIEASIKTLLENKIDLTGMQVIAPNLEDLFLLLTGTSLRN
ncbi:MAG: ABC transporter ATP-binding protein [Spirochaetes bacterium]|nr:ABC transporter ATP-binding protein [Spirochaetota bacterium]